MSVFDDSYVVSDDGCWEWTGYADKNGYARIYDRGAKQIKWAHRYSYERHVGPIPHRHEIDHMCENTLCVNPDHLQAVTRAEHARITMQRLGKEDVQLAAAHMRRKGYTYQEIADALRHSSRSGAFSAVRAAITKGLVGADDIPPAPRLSDDERDEIRALYVMGIPQGVIAAFYEIDSSHASRICNGLRSGHDQKAS